MIFKFESDFSQIDSIVDNFERTHKGYEVDWHAINGIRGVESVCFKVTYKPGYVMKVGVVDADGVLPVSMESDGTCIRIAKSASAQTLIHAVRGMEFIVESTLNSMVDEIKEHRKCGLTGNWVLPDGWPLIGFCPIDKPAIRDIFCHIEK